MKDNRMIAVAMAATVIFGAFLCCSFISDSSEAAFPPHESTRGMMTDSTTPTSTSSGTPIYGTVLNPHTGIDITVKPGGGIVYVKTGSQAIINLGGTSQNHSNLLSHGWSYSNGTYTRTVTADMHENWFYLSGKTITLRPVTNPGYAVDGQLWYGASSPTEPLLGLSMSSADAITGFGETLYLAVGASVYLGPFPESIEGEQYLYPNSIGLSTASNGSITGVVSSVGTAKLFTVRAGEGENEVTLSSVNYSEPVIITASDMVVIQNTTLTFTPVPSGNTVSISGAPWLSVNGNVVSGTPTVVGDYTVTITSGESSKTITIRVISQLNVTNSPANGVIIMPS